MKDKKHTHLVNTEFRIKSGSSVKANCGKWFESAEVQQIWDYQEMMQRPEYPARNMCQDCLALSIGRIGEKHDKEDSSPEYVYGVREKKRVEVEA